MRISDWSSDVCSSDLMPGAELARAYGGHDHAVRTVLSTVQDAIVAELPQARQQAMQAVLRQNYPEHMASLQFDLVLDHDNLPGYVQRQSGHGQLRDRKSVV